MAYRYDYLELCKAFRELYGYQHLSLDEFIGALTQIQTTQPLMNYTDSRLYEQIYREMLPMLYHISIERVFEFTYYLVNKNRQAIKDNDIVFYEELLDMLESNGKREFESKNFIETLKKKQGLNYCLKLSLIGCFKQVKVVSVRKFRALVYQLKQEIDSGSLDFIEGFEMSQSMYGDSSKIYQQGIKGNMEKSIIGYTPYYFPKKMQQFLERVIYECSQEAIVAKAEKMAYDLSKFYQWWENDRVDKTNMIESLSAEKRDFVDELEQYKSHRYLLEKQIDTLERKAEKNNAFIEDISQERQYLNQIIRSLSNTLNEKTAYNAYLRDRLKNLTQDIEFLKQTLRYSIEFQEHVKSDNTRLMEIIERQQEYKNYSMGAGLKEELEYAYGRINMLQYKADYDKLKIEHYERELEQLGFQMEHLHNQLASRIDVQRLREEGVRQSELSKSRMFTADRSMMYASRMGASRLYGSRMEREQLGASKLFKNSVMGGHLLKPPALDKSMGGNHNNRSVLKSSVLAFNAADNIKLFDNKLSKIVDDNKSSLVISINSQYVPFTPPKAYKTPSPDKRFAKKKQGYIVYRHFDEGYEMYKYDFGQVRDIDKIKEVMVADRDSCYFMEYMMDKRFQVFSCDVRHVSSNGKIDNYTMVITCSNIHLVNLSKGKPTFKQPVKLSEVRKLIFGYNSYLVVIRFGGVSDYLLLTNRRREMALFLTKQREYMDDPLPIEKFFLDKNIIVIYNKKYLYLVDFKLIFTAYTASFQYYQFCSYVYLEFKKMLGTEYRAVFLVVNYSGLYFLSDDNIETKHHFQEKLILYLPINPYLNVIEFGSLDDKDRFLKVAYTNGMLNPYMIKCKSAAEKEDLVAQISSIRKVMNQRKFDMDKEDKAVLRYREAD